MEEAVEENDNFHKGEEVEEEELEGDEEEGVDEEEEVEDNAKINPKKEPSQPSQCKRQ